MVVKGGGGEVGGKKTQGGMRKERDLTQIKIV